MSNDLNVTDGGAVFNYIKNLFLNDGTATKDHDSKSLKLNNDGIKIVKFPGLLESKLIADIILPKKMRVLMDSTKFEMKIFIHEHVKNNNQNKSTIYRAFKIQIKNNYLVLLFEFLNCSYHDKDSLLLIDTGSPFCELLVDYIYKPRTMFIYNFEDSKLLYKTSITTPVIDAEIFEINE